MLRSLFRNRPAWTRGLIHALVVGQILGAVPIAAADEAPEKAEVRPAAAPLVEEPPVEVNRTPPAAQALPSMPQFSDPPTDGEIADVHVFEEPLIPIGRATTAAENTALALAITTYISAGGGEDLSPFEGFLAENPETPWRAALLTGFGIVYRRTGYFSKALTAWEDAWTAAKGATDEMGNAIADRALAEFAELSARLGRFERLEALFAEVGSRDVHGSAAEKLFQAREGLVMMREKPGQAFRCGPMALDRIMAYGNASYRPDKRITHAESTQRGTSLLQVQELSQTVGLNLQMAFRPAGVPPVVPEVVHWKAGHFAALVAERDGRYLIQDPTFGNELWVSRKALDDEASGYALIPSGALPAGWRTVRADEGGQVWGKGFTDSNNSQNQTCQDPAVGGASGGCPANASCPTGGMAQYKIHSMLVALNINDQPVGYTPARGPAVAFQASYHQREVYQPQITQFGNLGPKWTYGWLSAVDDNPTKLDAPVNVYLRLGGQETYNFDLSTQSYTPHSRSRAVVVRTSTSPITYERRLPDGSKEVFAQSDGSPSVPRKVFLTSWSDPQGNTVSLTYNGLKLVSVTDAIGQVTTLSYELPGRPLRITKVTDPFGRFATFEYNAQGQLWKITDVIGIVSEFTYGTGDFITTLTTPYGTTGFTTAEVPGSDSLRWAEATDPLGAMERVEFRHSAPGIAASEPVNKVPVVEGVTYFNEFLHARNTFFWDKRASPPKPWQKDYTKAVITHWAHDVDTNVASGIIESEKRPLENRVWYSYQGQTNPAFLGGSLTAGPATVARVLDDGSTQLLRYEYNVSGKVCKATDPLGRETRYTYGTNNVADPVCTSGSGIDLLKVEQKNGSGGYDLIQEYTYNAKHQPLTIKDAAGQTTTYTYLTDGRMQTVVTPPRAGLTVAERTTTYAYYPDNAPTGAGRLQTVTGPSTPQGSPVTGYTYDAYGRVRTVTDPDVYVLTYDYDAFDRPTRTTYPDATYEQTAYNRLDAVGQRDRLGRWNYSLYDPLRRPVAMRDPLGRTVTQQWCNCGSLDKLIDASGNATSWEQDLQGRVIKETRADGSFKTFVYENTTSRLKSVTDARNQTKTYGYALDDRLTSTTYTNAVVATPNVTFSYMDPDNPTIPDPYGRLRGMTDGTGTTRYDYKPAGTLGAGSLSNVEGPLTSDTVSYSYDELGRVTTHGLTAFSTTSAYDALGRLNPLTSPMGNFVWTYVNTSGRPQTVTYPNSQVTTYMYFPNLGDQRLQQIKHRQTSAGTVLSQFDYTYDAVGNIKTWTQKRGSDPAKAYLLNYDPADQLLAATVTGPNPLPVPSRFRYAYDQAGNRSAEQLDDAGMGASYNSRNQLTSRQPGGTLLFRGTLNEQATVTVQGKPTEVASNNSFAAQAQVGSTTTDVVVAATDPSSNTRTNTYRVTQSGSTTTYTHDPNGNLTGDGTRTFEWDAEDRLTRVCTGTCGAGTDPANMLARFVYDGQGRRAQKIAGGVTRSYVYDGANIIEERLSSGQTYNYVHGPGIDQPLARRDQASVVSYYLADHLGSIAQTTSAAGVVTLTREYDSWGNPIQGGASSGFAFTGREWDTDTGLYYYRARYYDPKVGRFLSEDPLGMDGENGANVYPYVLNDPVNLTDPFGEAATPAPPANPSPTPPARRLPPGKPWSTLHPMDKVWPQMLCRDRAFGTQCAYAVTVGSPPPFKASPLPGGAFGRGIRSPAQQKEWEDFIKQFKRDCEASTIPGKWRQGVCEQFQSGQLICACCERCST